MNLMSLANAYLHMDRHEKAIYIYQKLLECLNMDYISGEYVEHMQILVMRNLSLAYLEIKRYEEALTLNDDCLKRAKEKNEGKEVHVLLSDRAAIILNQIKNGERSVSDRELAKKYLRQSYFLAAARGDKISAEIYRKAYKEKINEFL